MNSIPEIYEITQRDKCILGDLDLELTYVINKDYLLRNTLYYIRLFHILMYIKI